MCTIIKAKGGPTCVIFFFFGRAVELKVHAMNVLKLLISRGQKFVLAELISQNYFLFKSIILC